MARCRFFDQKRLISIIGHFLIKSTWFRTLTIFRSKSLHSKLWPFRLKTLSFEYWSFWPKTCSLQCSMKLGLFKIFDRNWFVLNFLKRLFSKFGIKKFNLNFRPKITINWLSQQPIAIKWRSRDDCLIFETILQPIRSRFWWFIRKWSKGGAFTIFTAVHFWIKHSLLLLLPKTVFGQKLHFLISSQTKKVVVFFEIHLFLTKIRVYFESVKRL